MKSSVRVAVLGALMGNSSAFSPCLAPPVRPAPPLQVHYQGVDGPTHRDTDLLAGESALVLDGYPGVGATEVGDDGRPDRLRLACPQGRGNSVGVRQGTTAS